MESMEQSLHYILIKHAQQEDDVGDGVGELLDGDLNVKLIMSQVTFKTSFFYHNYTLTIKISSGLSVQVFLFGYIFLIFSWVSSSKEN